MRQTLVALVAAIACLIVATLPVGCSSAPASDNSAAPMHKPAPAADAPAWAGEWVNKEAPFLAMTLSADSFERRTYNSEARKELFTGSRGKLTADGDMLTMVTSESYSASMKWYRVADETRTVKVSVADGELTVVIDSNKDGTVDAASGDESVVYVRP